MTWAGTCGISRKAIQKGDPVIAYPLIRMNPALGVLGGGGFSSASDGAKPFSTGIRGKYNGFGGVMDCATDQVPIAALVLHQERACFSFSSRQHLDGVFDFANIETVLNLGFERGSFYLALPDRFGQTTFHEVGLMLVHAPLHDLLIAELSRDQGDQVQSEIKACLEALPPQRPDEFSLDYHERQQRFKRGRLSALLPELLVSPEAYVKQWAPFALETGEDAIATRNELAELVLFHLVLTALSIPWAVQLRKGFAPENQVLSTIVGKYIQEKSHGS
jgi:hypothetical protein